MKSRDNGRIIEGTLSLGALLLVLIPVWILVYLGKMRETPPANALLVNSATAEQFAAALGIDPEIAARPTAWRDHHKGFESVDSLLDVPLFAPEEAPRLAALLQNSAFDTHKATARNFAAALGVSLPIARRLASYRDSLLPTAFETLAASPPPNPLREGRLTPVSLLQHAPLLDANTARPLLNRFVVRKPAEVMLHFWIGVGIFALAMLLLPAWLRARNRGGDPFLVPIALLLSGLGVAILFSVKDPLRDRAVYEHHLYGLLFSLIVMAFCARIAPFARARIKNYLYVWVIAAFLLVGALFVFGSGPEGVKLNLFHFQPVEIIKLFLIFFLAAYLADRADLIADISSRRLSSGTYVKPSRPPLFTMPRRQDLGPVIVMFVVALMLFLVIKDMGPGLLMFGTFVVLLCLMTGRGSFLLTGAILLVVGGLLGYFLHFGVFSTRVDMWLHPYANTHPNGMQLGQGYWGLASGGWSGSGPGLGMPALIPRSGSDLAFASWGEETGLAGTWLTLILYIVLVWRGIQIALRAGSDFDRALAFGLTSLLGLQTLLILGGVTGAIPLSGISLPFMSYGNSALVAAFVVVGLLRGISSHQGANSLPSIVRPAVTEAAKRFVLVYTALVLFGIGAMRLWVLQVAKADETAIHTISTPDADGVRRPHINPRILALERQIERGSIYDAAGRVVATSRYEEIVQAGKDKQTAQKIALRRGRYYPFGAALGHLVGYLDPAVGGPFGLEKAYNAELRGFKQENELLQDYRRRNLPNYVGRRGQDIYLTIDAGLQRDVLTILARGTEKLKDKTNGKPKDRAAFVLMRPDTGDVLVAATLPSFDPNGLTPEKLRSLVIGPDAEYEHTLINRAVSGWYPPGSTMKVATAAVALDTLPNAENFSFVCNKVSPNIVWQAHGEHYSRANVRDDKGDPDFGRLELSRAFTVSSNIYFANLAAHLEPDVYRARLTDKLGFKHVPKQQFFDADLPDIGYGQGRMLASPLEMCRLSATVANGGNTMESRLITKTVNTRPNHGKQPRVQERPPVVFNQGMTAATAQTIRGLMRRVVTEGTARGVFEDLPFAVAGKTGTAQNHQYDREPHSWFIGFAPYSTDTPPRYAFACVVENGGYGKTVAAVICKEVLQRVSKQN